MGEVFNGAFEEDAAFEASATFEASAAIEASATSEGRAWSGGSVPKEDTRHQYRVALAEQLKVGLAENRQIDLRDAKHEVVVAFEDEPIRPVWHELAIRDAEVVHLFVAPTDFESGRLTMLSLVGGGRELRMSDQVVEATITFGELVTQLRCSGSGDDGDCGAHDDLSGDSEHRFQVIEAPASIYHDGLAYSFAFSELVDV